MKGLTTKLPRKIAADIGRTWLTLAISIGASTALYAILVVTSAPARPRVLLPLALMVALLLLLEVGSMTGRIALQRVATAMLAPVVFLLALFTNVPSAISQTLSFLRWGRHQQETPPSWATEIREALTRGGDQTAQVLATLRELAKSPEHQVADHMARAAALLREYKRQEAIDQMRAIFRLGITEAQRAEVHNLIGIAFFNTRDLTQAESEWKQCQQSAIVAEYPEAKAAALGNLGLIQRVRGDLEGAEKYHRDALKLHEEIGNKEGQANQRGNLGTVARDRGDLDSAVEYYKQALHLFVEVGAKPQVEQTRRLLEDLEERKKAVQ